MNEISKKFSDITEVFSADGYAFIKVRSALEKFAEDAKSGDKDAEQLVRIFNQFHKLMVTLSK